MKDVAYLVQNRLKEKLPELCLAEIVLEEMEVEFEHKILTILDVLLMHLKKNGFYSPYPSGQIDIATYSYLSATERKNVFKFLQSFYGHGKQGIIFHLDNIEEWAMDIDSSISPDGYMRPENYKWYYLAAFCAAVKALRLPKVQFVLTGCSLNQASVIYRTTKVKCKTFHLPYFSIEVVEQLFECFCDTKHLAKETLCKKVLSKLVGCPKNFEYFIFEVYRTLNGAAIDVVTIEALEQVYRLYTTSNIIVR